MKPILETVKCRRGTGWAGGAVRVPASPGRPLTGRWHALKRSKDYSGIVVLGLGLGLGFGPQKAGWPSWGKPHKSYCFSTSLSLKSAHELRRGKMFSFMVSFYAKPSRRTCGRTRSRLSCQPL